MGDQGASVRIGDGEREAAVAALVAHREAGRLDPVEFEERQVAVSQARTWGEVGPLFADLPDPRPAGMPATVVPLPVAGHGAVSVPADDGVERSAGVLGAVVPARYRDTVMAIMPFAALLLFFTLHSWMFFLLIPVMAILLYGAEGKPGRRRDRRR
jgi:hypothetical protein